MNHDDLTIEFGPVPGSGAPPLWHFRIVRNADGQMSAHMSGPRLLVLTTLERWVALFEQESRPA